MDSMDNVRERFEALERQTEQLKYQTHRHSRQAGWWWGIVCDLLIVSLVSLSLPSAIAQDAQSTAAEATHAASYTFTTITTINVPDGGMGTPEANGINNRGAIVGLFRDITAQFRNRGFLLLDDFLTAIDAPDSQLTTANGINNRGQIVGVFVATGSSRSNGFLLSRGILTPIDVPGSTSTTPTGINNRGQIVGTYGDPVFHGFLLSNGSFTTINVPQGVIGTTMA